MTFRRSSPASLQCSFDLGYQGRHIRAFQGSDVELVLHGGRAPTDTHGHGHRMPPVGPPLDVGEGLNPHEPLAPYQPVRRWPGQYRRPPQVRRRLADYHAGQAFHIVIVPEELGQPHDKGFHPVVPAEFPDVFGSCPEFRQHRRRKRLVPATLSGGSP